MRGGTALNVAAVAVADAPARLPPASAVRRRRGRVRRLGGARARRRAARDLSADARRARRDLLRGSVRARCATRCSPLGLLYSDRWPSPRRRGPAGTPRRSSWPRSSSRAASGRSGAWRVAGTTSALAVERAAEERAAVAAAEERTRRIARDFHDAVSHSLASIVMQAGGAQDVSRASTPSAPARRSRSIERDRAAQGLGEMRRLLGLIGDGAARRASRSRPLARLGEMRRGRAQRRARRSHTTRRGRGAAAALRPSTCQRYRIVQEALTNADEARRRCRADVRRAVRRLKRLELEIADDGARGAGRRRPPAAEGSPACASASAVLGGAFAAGPRGDGRGFRCAARGCRWHEPLRVPCCSPTTRSSSAPGCEMIVERRGGTSRSSARPADGVEAVALAVRARARTWCSWMSGCPAWTASRRPGCMVDGRRRTAGRDADDVRPRRVRLRGLPGGSERLPPQGRSARATSSPRSAPRPRARRWSPRR